VKKPNRRNFATFLRQDKIMSAITAVPAVLYFPREVSEQLNELCRVRQLTAQQLMAEALKSQESRFDQFTEDVMKPRKPGESTTWPEDPLYCLACGTMRHFTRNFLMMMDEPASFEEMKKDAPAEWSFGSIEDLDEPDQADWWKADDPE
jgi:hypothetical protein